MATINGTSLNMENLRVVSIHRNEIIDIPGSDTNYITDMGYDGLVLRLEGYETSLSDYDDVIAEFMKSGPQTLVYRTGWQYTVYSAQLTPTLLEGYPDNYFPYDILLLTSTPYRESTSETTRTKTITTNNQEWSQDNSANDIDTSGNVDAKPNIQITGGAVASSGNRSTGTTDSDLVVGEISPGTSWTLVHTKTYSAVLDRGWKLTNVGMDLKSAAIAGFSTSGKVTYTAASLNGGAETDIPSASWSRDYNTYADTWGSYDTDAEITAAINEDLVVKFYGLDSGPYNGRVKNYSSNVDQMRRDVCKSPQVYNITNTTIKADVANEIDPDMVVLVNIDGTGTITYADDITTDKYKNAYWTKTGITYDDPNNELDFGNSENLVYKFDTKHPITGIPTLTATIDIDTGTPTIQISEDDSTWYEIDTAIVDNVSISYELDNASNLSLKGLTTFYLKFDCVAAATCSLVNWAISIAIITIDIEHPVITTGGAASTFRCDQHTDSGLNCIISLIYRDRSWSG